MLEGICAGVPIITWPMSSEQFYNKKLVMDVLKVGIGIGVKRWVIVVGDSLRGDAVEKAVRRIMVSEGRGNEEKGKSARGNGKRGC